MCLRFQCRERRYRRDLRCQATARRSGPGSSSDIGSANGIGLAMSAGYLYAGFTDSSTIATFQLVAGCKLTYVSSMSVIRPGRRRGRWMSVPRIMPRCYLWGRLHPVVRHFWGSAGLNGDEQNSTGSSGSNWPSQVDITQDGHFAIFGDVSTATVVEVSDISSGKLTPTLVYRLGHDNNSANIWLSPDESLLYVANTQGGEVEAAFFDQTTGTLSKGCAIEGLEGVSRTSGRIWRPWRPTRHPAPAMSCTWRNMALRRGLGWST